MGISTYLLMDRATNAAMTSTGKDISHSSILVCDHFQATNSMELKYQRSYLYFQINNDDSV